MKAFGVDKPANKLEAAKYLVKILFDHVVNDNESNAYEVAHYVCYYIYGSIEGKFPNSKYVGDSLGLEHVVNYLYGISDCKNTSMNWYRDNVSRYEVE